MNCPQCGEVCSCHSELACLAPPQETQDSPAEADAWRNELTTRLNRYRARRKVRPPRYPSLRVQFHSLESLPEARAVAGSPAAVFESVSNQALALDGIRLEARAGTEAEAHLPEADVAKSPEVVGQASSAKAPCPGAGAKIIEFPRFAWAPPTPLPDQLADPIAECPRILEVPDVEPPPPALGGINIEAPQPREVEKRPGIDVPLQSASLPRRLLAVAVDGLIVATGSAIFGGIFWKVTSVRPPLIQLLGLGLGIPCLLWATYQYLLMVYGASTPGLQAAGLELALFDGGATNRSLRRWRVLASYLSAASLGMGYAWAFLDEDVLCWHDRITHTHLARRK